MYYSLLPVVLTLLLAFAPAVSSGAPKPITVASPDGKLVVTVDIGNQITYAVSYGSKEVLAPSPISLTLMDGRVLGTHPKLKKQSKGLVDQPVTAPIYFKSQLKDRYNELRLDFKDGYSVVFRAFDQGIAYRLETSLSGTIQVKSEGITYALTGDHVVTAVPTRSFMHTYENLYVYEPISAFGKADTLAALPVVLQTADGLRLGITEADLYDYPGFYLKPDPSRPHTLVAVQPPYPLEEKPGYPNIRNRVVVRAAEYVSETTGTRTFPWRILVVAPNDAALLDNDLVYLLSRPPAEGSDFSWVKPGKVAWDWWHANAMRDVPFESGINTDTYKKYIDFAAANGIDYINIDEGWSDNYDLLKLKPNVNMEEITRYAHDKGVGVILWCVARTVDAQMVPALDQFSKWGIKGIKVDFMDRDDQIMVNFYERTAREAAKRKIVVNFHGAYKPTGMNRAYPNIINHEAVRGLEYNKWDPIGSPPLYTATVPFVRMLAGYMDYTPGAMTNAQGDDYRPIFRRPMSRGTRCHQLALYVTYFAPLQMFSDAPYRYEAEPAITRYIAHVPEVWDETRAIDGKIGQFAVLARRSGDTWYLSALEGGNGRELSVDLSFLGAGSFKAEVFRDGPNASILGEDYVREERQVASNESIHIKLAPGGGTVAIFRPER